MFFDKYLNKNSRKKEFATKKDSMIIINDIKTLFLFSHKKPALNLTSELNKSQ